MSDIKRTIWVEDGTLNVLTEQDVYELVEENKRLQKEKQTGDFRKTSSIPLNLLNIWLNESLARGCPWNWNSPEFWEYINRKILRDPDWKNLRCQG